MSKAVVGLEPEPGVAFPVWSRGPVPGTDVCLGKHPRSWWLALTVIPYVLLLPKLPYPGDLVLPASSQLVQFKCCASLVKDYKQDRLPFVIAFSCTVIDLDNLDLEKVSWQQRVWLRVGSFLLRARLRGLKVVAES